MKFLEIVDIHGCRSSYTNSDVNVIELDTIVAVPILNMLHGLILVLSILLIPYFFRLEVWNQRVDGFSNWLSANMNIDSLTPNYFYINLVVLVYQIYLFANNYFIQ